MEDGQEKCEQCSHECGCEPKPDAPQKKRRSSKSITRQGVNELTKFRIYDDAGWVGGVCAGVAYRLGAPTWVIRLAWAIAVLGYGVGIVAYLALWVLVPNAPTPRDYVARTGDQQD